MSLLVATLLAADDPVVDGTLGRHLRLLGVPPAEVTLVCGSGDATPSWAGRVVVVPVRPRPTWPLRFLRAVAGEARRQRPGAVYVRDETSAALVALLPRRVLGAPLLLDKRGLPVTEAEANGRSAAMVRALRTAESFTARRATRAMTVTSVIADHLRRLGAPEPVVVPNGYLRAEQQVTERADPPVVAYVGGGQTWQCCEETLDLLLAIRKTDPRIDVRVYTGDAELKRRAAGAGITVRTATRDELRADLPAFAAVIALRRNDSVARSASPVKLGDALAHGTDVIATNATWEGIEALAAETAGVRLFDLAAPDVDDVVSWLWQRAAMTPAARAAELSRVTALQLDTYLPRLREFYLGG